MFWVQVPDLVSSCWEECRCRQYDSREVRRIFGYKGVEITVGWRNEEFNGDLHEILLFG
jgi:hypothetical protein